MTATKHYEVQAHAHDQQHLLSPTLSSGLPSPLKPLHLVENQHHRNPSYENFEDIKDAQYEDAQLKSRIRRLRVISRVLAFLISVAVLIPITMTLIKFLRTRNTYRTVTLLSGQTISRTAWARNTRAWPTYMYFGVAAVSMILNFATVFSYKFGVSHANVASYVTNTFSWVVMIGNLAVWCVAASIYRTEKDKGGKSDDLWGWTCSAAARAIQGEFAKDVDFNRFCNVQSISWYIGLVQAGAAILTIVIYILVLKRRKTKKTHMKKLRLSGYEPTRR